MIYFDKNPKLYLCSSYLDDDNQERRNMQDTVEKYKYFNTQQLIL